MAMDWTVGTIANILTKNNAVGFIASMTLGLRSDSDRGFERREEAIAFIKANAPEANRTGTGAVRRGNLEGQEIPRHRSLQCRRRPRELGAGAGARHRSKQQPVARAPASETDSGTLAHELFLRLDATPTMP